ncbi:GtrA family protein [Streptomyces cavernicola]|uniref:GtrA family protein n=1 Tax=Streptomyces cavernicola TaxID=3043613 RepID=A0ABT6S7A5_9ACTN|nr:GtrA family protein [Streptomyces sp. B-S-A6]MDI3403985.1 GtrA family protein [Streptomyces sp. B-S-A6]
MWTTLRPFLSADTTRFLLVGGLCYAIDVGTLVLLHGVLNMQLAAATSLAFVTVLVVNFGLNRSFVFRSGNLAGQAFVKYLALVALNYCATVATVTGLTALGLAYVVAKTVSTVANAVANYCAFRWWIFRAPAAQESDAPGRPEPVRES